MGRLSRLIIDLGHPDKAGTTNCTTLDTEVHYLKLNNRHMMYSDFDVLKGWLEEKQNNKVEFNFLQNGACFLSLVYCIATSVTYLPRVSHTAHAAGFPQAWSLVPKNTKRLSNFSILEKLPP